MPFFVDSNVVIGYYFFCGDHWGHQAKRVIEKPELKHSSTTVWQECFGVDGTRGKCKTLFREIKGEFFNAISLLTQDGFTPLDLYSLAVDEKWKILEIIQELAGKYEHDIKELIRKLRGAERKYESDCNDRLTTLQKPTTLQIHERDVDYPETKQILDSVIEDESDVLILLDAHHTGFIIEGLEFVTGDYHHIIQQKKTIIANTKISDVLYLDNI